MVFLLVWAATSEGFGLDDLDELPGGILSKPAPSMATVGFDCEQWPQAGGEQCWSAVSSGNGDGKGESGEKSTGKEYQKVLEGHFWKRSIDEQSGSAHYITAQV